MEYMRFSDEVESIFTQKNLEKTPTADVVQFVPPVDSNMYVLSPEEEQTLQKAMHRLAERVRCINVTTDKLEGMVILGYSAVMIGLVCMILGCG